MSHQSTLIESDIETYLSKHENKELLRFITCGSVDDGKSTLIGRLLHDSKMIYEDQLESIAKESKKTGSNGGDIDLALLVDGLQSEREQGITIDVAYRYFSTEKRKFIIADTPGHEQYTRNMATGASTAGLAIILVDAFQGLQTQTRRHSYLVKLLGIKHVIVAINKMDMVNFSQARFEDIRKEYLAFAEELALGDVQIIPISALKGDNVVDKSMHMEWYAGEPLMHLLDNIELTDEFDSVDFNFPVQYVNRPNQDFRGFSGTIACGQVSVGDKISVFPSEKTSTVKSIVTYDGELKDAESGMAVTLTLNEEIDISRGDVIVKSDADTKTGNTFDVELVWMSEEPLTLHNQFYIKRGTSAVVGNFDKLYYKVDVNSFEKNTVTSLSLNEIGLARLSLTESLVYELYETNREMGGFIVIDRITNNTVAAGMITGISDERELIKPNKASNHEIELNAFIRKHYPHWGCKEIT